MTDDLPPAHEWEIDQIVALDWYDGPRSGVCRIRRPSIEVAFDLLDERPTVDDLDDRLYYLSSLPTGSVKRLMDALAASCGDARTPIWVPQWPTSTAERTSLDQAVAEILKHGQDMDVVIWSRDFQTIRRIWRNQKRKGATDWFRHLGL